MVLESQRRRLWEVYKRSRIRRGVKAIVLSLVLAIVLFADAVPAFLSLQGNILYLVVLVLISLEIIESKVYEIEDDIETVVRQKLQDIEDGLDTNRSARAYRNTRSAYLSLGKSMRERSGGRVYLVHYLGSSFSTRHAITTAKDNEFEIYLLLKHPSTVDDPSMITNEDLKEQVFILIEQILPSYFKDYEDLHIRFYRYQASVNAIKISDRDLAVGWYTFHDENGQPRKVNDDLNPTLVFDQNSANYSVMDEWFRDVFTELWQDAVTLEEMYEQGEPRKLEEWVDHEEAERRSLLNQLSEGHPKQKDQLFPRE